MRVLIQLLNDLPYIKSNWIVSIPFQICICTLMKSSQLISMMSYTDLNVFRSIVDTSTAISLCSTCLFSLMESSFAHPFTCTGFRSVHIFWMDRQVRRSQFQQ